MTFDGKAQSHQGLMTLMGWLELLDSSGSIQHFLDSAQRAPNEKGPGKTKSSRENGRHKVRHDDNGNPKKDQKGC